MLIKITKDVFESDNDKAVKLLIDEICYHARYELFIDLESLEAFQNINLYHSLDADYQEIIKRSFIRVIEQSLESNFVITKNGLGNTFTIEEAMRFLNQPVSIILENSVNDAYFLKALIKNFKKKSKKIQLHLANNWLIYVHGGGSTIDVCIKTILERHQNLPKAAQQYMRCFVLLDSDKEYPTMPLKNSKITDILKLHGIPYHILEKREMENYMPDIAFETIKNNENKNYIQAYLQLSPIQKDFFDIQNGLPDKNRISLPKEIQTFYNTVSDENFVIFRKNKLKYDNFKAEFPKLFESVDQKAFVERTTHQINKNELQEILEKITNLL
jgi:hypothetical protein